MEFLDYGYTIHHFSRDILKTMIGEEFEFSHCTDDNGLLVVVNSFQLQFRSFNSLMRLSSQWGENQQTFT